MGYMVHHAIIVTSWDLKYIKLARDKAVEIFSVPVDEDDKPWSVVSQITFSPMNGYSSFFIAPDGSKAGWEHSDSGDEKRDRFIEWMKNQRKTADIYLSWAEVQYADDDGDNHMTRNSGDGVGNE